MLDRGIRNGKAHHTFVSDNFCNNIFRNFFLTRAHVCDEEILALVLKKKKIEKCSLHGGKSSEVDEAREGVYLKSA